MMTLRRLSILASAALMLTAISGVSTIFGDSSTPANYISINFSPIITTVSYNYNFLTGKLTQGTATATALVINNAFLTLVSDSKSDPNNGFGTFFGTARPVRFDHDTVVYTTSHCPGWPAFTCLSDGTLTFGGFVMVHHFGGVLDQLTTLATQYNIQAGDCGGWSPTGGASSGTQTVLFRSIQVNGVTRFP